MDYYQWTESCMGWKRRVTGVLCCQQTWYRTSAHCSTWTLAVIKNSKVTTSIPAPDLAASPPSIHLYLNGASLANHTCNFISQANRLLIWLYPSVHDYPHCLLLEHKYTRQMNVTHVFAVSEHVHLLYSSPCHRYVVEPEHIHTLHGVSNMLISSHTNAFNLPDTWRERKETWNTLSSRYSII